MEAVDCDELGTAGNCSVGGAKAEAGVTLFETAGKVDV